MSTPDLGTTPVVTDMGVKPDGGAEDPDGGAPQIVTKYLISASVTTPNDGFSNFLTVTDDIPNGALGLDNAIEFVNGAAVGSFGENVYIFSGQDFRITSYTLDGSSLVPGQSINLSDRGFTFTSEMFFLSATRAFVLNPGQRKVLEWNPTDMTITGEIDLASVVQRDDFDLEFRGAFMRASDATLFSYITYTNMRQTFLNEFKLVVIDLNSGDVKVETKADCPSTAGFGGFFDDAGDLYMIADSFGTFTSLQDQSDVKDNCVLRVRADSRVIDDSYLFKPKTVLGGSLEMWGMYRTSDDTFYTSAIDTSRLGDFMTPFEFIFAPIHEGYLINFRDQTASKVGSFPPDGVSFREPINVDGELFLARTTGMVTIMDIEN
ncbi:MAG: hypothetical protein AAFU79_34000, partial [Myxococcota bacterium]